MTSIFGSHDRYYGDPAGFVAWDGSHILRTADILASSPVWARVDSGISGTIYDYQQVIQPSDAVGAWLLTSTGVWWCADIQAASPAWSQVLSIATIQASDAVPSSGVVEVKCFATCQSADGFCVVATGPVTIFTNADYAHSYFWHTHDHGATWTKVDNGATGSGGFHFAYADRLAMQCNPNLVSGNVQIWCIRSSPVNVLAFTMKVFESTDGGHTWAASAANIASGLNNRNSAALLAPFESGDPAYSVNGDVGATSRPPIRISTSDWATATAQTVPSGYGGTNNDNTAYRRPEKKQGDVNHLVAWFRHSAEPESHLLESADQGATWSLLYDQNTSQQYGTPVPWPGNTQVWVWVINRATSNLTPVANVVRRTIDYFANVADASGNLNTLLSGGWVFGLGGGCYLPNPFIPCEPHAHYVYNGVDITAYINSLELEAAIEEVETTRLSDTATTKKARLPSNGISLGGDWNPTLDALLGADAMRGSKRSGVAQFDDCTTEVTLTWAEAFVTNWQVKTVATDKITWTAKLRHNGKPVRSTALD